MWCYSRFTAFPCLCRCPQSSPVVYTITVREPESSPSWLQLVYQAVCEYCKVELSVLNVLRTCRFIHDPSTLLCCGASESFRVRDPGNFACDVDACVFQDKDVHHEKALEDSDFERNATKRNATRS